MNGNEKAINIFEKMPVPRALFTMIVPTVLSQLIVLIYSMADTYFIGKTNNPNMVAAVSLLLPIYNLTIPLANLTGVGGGTLISRLIAKNEHKEAKKVCNASFYICLSISLLYSLIFLLFYNGILYGLGATKETFLYAKNYAFFVIILGAVPISLSSTMANLIRSCGFSKEAGFGIILGGVINIILDPIFMFIVFGKGHEVEGAAFATLLSNIIAVLYFFYVSYRIKDKSSISYNLKIGFPKKENMKMLFTIGIPGSITPLCYDLDYIVLDKLMSSYGSVALAALGIVLKIEKLPLNTGVGICQAMNPMVAYNSSARNFKRTESIIRLSLLTGIVVSLLSLILYQTFTPQIMKFFINDIDTINIGTTFLKFRSLATTFMFISFFFSYLFQAFGEGLYSICLGFFRWCMLNIPLLFILNYILGMNGLVMAQFVADSMMSIISIIVYLRFKSKRKVYEKKYNS